MSANAPLLSQPLRFVSRLNGPETEPRLCVSIEIGQPLLDLMFNLWCGVASIANANEITSWSAALTCQVFDVVDDPGEESAQALNLTGHRCEVIFGVPIVNAEERGFGTTGCDVTVYADGDAVFHVKLNGVANALWTEGVFVLPNLVAH